MGRYLGEDHAPTEYSIKTTDKDEVKLWLASRDLVTVIRDIDNTMRSMVKHSEDDAEQDVAGRLHTCLWDTINDIGVTGIFE